MLGLHGYFFFEGFGFFALAFCWRSYLRSCSASSPLGTCISARMRRSNGPPDAGEVLLGITFHTPYYTLGVLSLHFYRLRGSIPAMDKFIPLRAIQGRIDKAISRIGEIEAERDRLLAEIDTLRALSAEAVAAPATTAPDASVRKHAKRPESTTAKIMELVEAEPGIRITKVSARLMDLIESESRDKRRVVYNSCVNLINRNQLRRDEDGSLWVVRDNTDQLYQQSANGLSH